MKVEGKDIFTVKSVNKNKPELKKDVAARLPHLLAIMKIYGITKIEL